MGNPLIDVQQPQIATTLQPPAVATLTNQDSTPANPLAVATPAVAAPVAAVPSTPAPAAAPSVPSPVTSFGQKLHAALLRSLPALAMSALGKGPGEGLEGAFANIAAAPGSGAALVAKT